MADPSAVTVNTLRWAVQQADAAGGASTIAFQGGMTGTISLTQGPLYLTGPNTTITGPGANTLAISGSQLSRVFQIATGVTASFNGLTIENGAADQGGAFLNAGNLTITGCTLSGSSASGNGGAISNTGTLSLASSTFSGNSAQVDGGGVFSQDALTITNCSFTGNTALSAGGGLYCSGTSTVTGSTFTNNTGIGTTVLQFGGGIANNGNLTLSASVFSGNKALQGGGLYNNGANTQNSLTVTTSTFFGNTVTLCGGGIENVQGTINISGTTFAGNTSIYAGEVLQADDGAGGGLDNVGNAVLTNCTFANNLAPNYGGGIDNELLAGATLTVSDCTIATNTAAQGGGVYLVNTATLNNTIVAGNTGGDVGLRNTQIVASSSYNLIGDGSGGLVNGTGGAAGNLLGTVSTKINAKLGPLAANGGPTNTMALLAGSPAIDAGSNSLIPTGVTTDQRGNGFPRIVDGTVDIGALESPQIATKLVFATVPGGAAVGNAITPAFTVNVEDYKNNVVTADASTITLSVATGPGTISGTTSAVAVNGLATFSNIVLSAAGTYTIKATDGTLTPAISGNVVAISATLTANKLNILVGTAETLTATLSGASGTPTGNVTFYDRSTSLGSAPLTGGVATLGVNTLAFGVHTITFKYNGDTNFSSVSSAPVSVFAGTTTHQVLVNALYRQLLNRNAEETASGLFYWAGRLDNGDPLSTVADGIATSVEYDTDLVTSIYQQYLNRAPDPTGLHNWVAQMQAGSVSYEVIRGYILGSQEFKNDVLAHYSDYVTGLYWTLLNRAPDPTGLAYWTQLLGSGATDTQRDPVSIGISTSFEQYEDFVTAKFQLFLNRAPSPALPAALPNANGVPVPTSPTLQGETGYWADALNHGTTDGDFIADILSSNEYLMAQGLPTS
jgi:predicted outer membrane repeat protein